MLHSFFPTRHSGTLRFCGESLCDATELNEHRIHYPERLHAAGFLLALAAKDVRIAAGLAAGLKIDAIKLWDT
jgi:hypothetical protein